MAPCSVAAEWTGRYIVRLVPDCWRSAASWAGARPERRGSREATTCPARFVIHTVGPVYQDGSSGEAALLQSCYESSLKLAAEAGVSTIAFPCISTGVYGYPKSEACEIAVSTVQEWLSAHDLPESVVFCCFDDESADMYRLRLGVVQ